VKKEKKTRKQGLFVRGGPDYEKKASGGGGGILGDRMQGWGAGSLTRGGELVLKSRRSGGEWHRRKGT